MEASKNCFKCGETKPLSNFYKHKEMADGHLNKCKSCAKADTKANRELREGYYKAYDRVRGRTPERKAANAERQRRDGPRKRHNEATKRSADKLWKRRDANIAVGNALRDGKLIKQPCFICGCLEVDGHHPDYDSPLDVVWLCRPHHAEIHREYDAEDDEHLLATAEKGSRWK